MQVDEQPDRINERLTEPVPEKIEQLIMRMLEKDPGRRPQSMAEVEALLIEAQLEARIQTPWDEELTLPPMDPDRATRIARRLSPTARSARLSLVAASSVAVLSVTLAIFFAMRDPEQGTPRSAVAEAMTPPASAAATSRQPVPTTPVPPRSAAGAGHAGIGGGRADARTAAAAGAQRADPARASPGAASGIATGGVIAAVRVPAAGEHARRGLRASRVGHEAGGQRPTERAADAHRCHAPAHPAGAARRRRQQAPAGLSRSVQGQGAGGPGRSRR